MKTEKNKEIRKDEYWRQDLKDAGIKYTEEDIVHEMIDGKDHTIIFGVVDQKGLLKMLDAEGEVV